MAAQYVEGSDETVDLFLTDRRREEAEKKSGRTNILDASAILALIPRENGHESVTAALSHGSGASTVDMAVFRCVRIGMPAKIVYTLMERLPVEWIIADIHLAYRVGDDDYADQAIRAFA